MELIRVLFHFSKNAITVNCLHYILGAFDRHLKLSLGLNWMRKMTSGLHKLAEALNLVNIS
jgi:hypothetical protein